MNRIRYFNFNIFKRFFVKNKNKNSDVTRSSDDSIYNDNLNQIIFMELNKLVKTDFDNIYEKIDNIDCKIKNINDILNHIKDTSFSINEKYDITDKKINLLSEHINEIINEMRKSEEIVLINN